MASPQSSDAPKPVNPRLSLIGWFRFLWRQLTSMRTAILLLLLLAIAAVPGSLVPQRSADPNGVSRYFADHPQLAPVLDRFQLFDVYVSVWFSAVYILLFVSLIGCVIPRLKYHLTAIRAAPPKTPARLDRLPAHATRTMDGNPADILDRAARQLRRSGFRVGRFSDPNRTSKSVSAERGYLRETGNLVFHVGMLGLLVAIGVGGGFGYTGQRIVVEGQSFVNTLAAYDSFNPGRFFQSSNLVPFRLTLNDFTANYYQGSERASLGQPIDYTARVGITDATHTNAPGAVKVNEPLTLDGSNIYLLGNGYAPTITVRNAAGMVVFHEAVPFLPQDANLTSLGVVKVTDGMPKQLGMACFFYPSAVALPSGALTSNYPDLILPTLTVNVFEGDLGINGGTPQSVYSLNTSTLAQITGGSTGVAALKLLPGETAKLPGNRGSVTFDNVAPNPSTNSYTDSVKRYVSFDIHHDPTQGWVFGIVVVTVLGLLLSLFMPRRRMWVRVDTDPEGGVRVECGALARGDDPGLADAVTTFMDRLAAVRT